MIKDEKRRRKYRGNDIYEGFCIDLLKAIAKYIGFEYEIKVVEDGMYGSYDETTKEWNGIIRELIDKV